MPALHSPETDADGSAPPTQTTTQQSGDNLLNSTITVAGEPVDDCGPLGDDLESESNEAGPIFQERTPKDKHTASSTVNTGEPVKHETTPVVSDISPTLTKDGDTDRNLTSPHEAGEREASEANPHLESASRAEAGDNSNAISPGVPLTEDAPDQANCIAARKTTSPSLASLADSAALELMTTLQNQLAESKATIDALKTELKSVRAELTGVKEECAVLRQEHEKMTSVILDNEVKARNDVKASVTSIQEDMHATVTTLANDFLALREKVDGLAKHKTSQDGKLQEIKKRVDNLANQTATQQPTTFLPRSTPSTSPDPPFSLPDTVSISPASPPSAPVPNVPTGLNTEIVHSVEVANKFDVLSLMDGEEQSLNATSTDNGKAECVVNQHKQTRKQSPKSTDSHHTPDRSSPLDKLSNTKIHHDVNSLLIGDSVTQHIDEKKMSVGDVLLQNISVSGLRVEHLMTWLATQSPVSHITHVTVHVGINSCWSGPVTKQTWLKLVRLLQRVFPEANLQMSSIVPPAGRHTLCRPAFTSNESLRATCEQAKVPFVDHVPTFLTASGAPRQILYHDKIHPSDRGVRSLARNIKNASRSPLSSGGDRLKPSMPLHHQHRYNATVKRDHTDNTRHTTGPPSYAQQHPATNGDLLRHQLSRPLHPAQQQDRVSVCPDRGQGGPPGLSDLEYPHLTPPLVHAPLIPPMASQAPRRWEQAGPSSCSSYPVAAMMMISQLMKPFFV
ncbi:hypothetical protein BaRGS_00018003 [Batillaria attramentaria]|uniref:SGNH hydrolase-type esterase domain-containing protein n=1 Tax=Batillaria attramentaria TaxID=370345 RepID=A0ABD0KU78_9CAEN